MLSKQLNRKGQSKFHVALFVGLIASMFFSGFAIYKYLQMESLNETGGIVEGTIFKRETLKTGKGRVSYSLKVDYYPANGPTYRKLFRGVAPEIYEESKLTGKVTVKYLKSNPEISALGNEIKGDTVPIGIGIGVFLFCLFIWFASRKKTCATDEVNKTMEVQAGDSTPADEPVKTTPELELLTNKLNADDFDVKRKAIRKCGTLGPKAAPIARSLLEGFFFWDCDDELTDEINTELANALISIGPACADIIIEDLGADEMDGIGQEILYGMGPDVIDALIKAVEDDHTLSQIRIFWRVAELLGQFGSKASSAIPALEKAANYEDSDYAQISSDAIAKILSSEQ